MSEHTKEPWRIGKYPDDEIHGKESVVVDLPERRKYVLFTCNTNFPEDAKANARRVVACVNACAGIPTEHLELCGEDFLCHYTGMREVEKIVQQRDELLAALKAIVADDRAGIDPDDYRAAKAAIAKVK